MENPPGPLATPDALANVPMHFRPAAGWQWLVRILRPPVGGLDTVPDLLKAMLQVAGPMLSVTYGVQFSKLCACLLEEGIGQCRAGFVNTNRPAARILQIELENWRDQGVFAPMKGQRMES